MGLFAYTALDAAGRTMTGTIPADTRAEAMDHVVRRGLSPIKVDEQKTAAQSAKQSTSTRVSQAAVESFTRELANLLAAGLPLSKSLQPPTPPSVTLLASDGSPIAKRGAIVAKPVDASKLPKYVPGAFIAIEDRRFYSHWGIDPWGIGRAMMHNIFAGRTRTQRSSLSWLAWLYSQRSSASAAASSVVREMKSSV